MKYVGSGGKIVLALSTLLMLNSCGSNHTTEVASNVGYYVDSPVQGVDYECGSFIDKTGEDGKFLFEKDLGCTFRLGTLELEKIEPSKLTDNATIKVATVEVAQLLQSLDKDGNATDGIEILPDVVRIVNEKITEIPSEPSILESLLEDVVETIKEEVEEYAGDVVTRQEAIEHLDTTAPTIVLNGEAEITLSQGETYEEAGVSVEDDYTPQEDIVVLMPDGVNTANVGDVVLTYTAIDLAGNEATVTRTVHIAPVENDPEDNTTDNTDDNATDSEDNVTDSEDNATEGEDNTTDNTDDNATDSEDNATEGEDNTTDNTDDNATDSEDNVTDSEDNATEGEDNTTDNTDDNATDSEDNATDSEDNATEGEDNTTDNTDDNATDSEDNATEGEDNTTDNTDDNSSDSNETVEFYANSDYIEYNDGIVPVNLDVLANDTYPEDANITLEIEDYCDWDEESDSEECSYVSEISTYEGIWRVETNNTITFIPSEEFEGGSVYRNYRMSDDEGHTSTSWVTIEYPYVIYAEFDYVQKDEIEAVEIDVLENDTGSGLQVKLDTWYENEYESETQYATHYQTEQGEWNVTEDNMVIFTPSSSFPGGTVYGYYQITDDQNRTRTTEIQIDYPVVLRAPNVSESQDLIEIYTADILNHEEAVYDAGENVTIRLCNENDECDVTSVANSDGNWSIVGDNQIQFVPSDSFDGGYVSIEYLMSQSGKEDRGYITVQYPRYLEAEYDSLYDLVTVAPLNIDVLANDTYPEDANITVELEVSCDWNEESGEDECSYATEVSTYEGIWRVEANNTISFMPSDDFIGGSVYRNYRMSDSEGHTATSEIYIDYPLLIDARWDDYFMSTLTALNMDVLANDEYNGTVRLQIRDDEGNYVEGEVETYQGVWRVEANNTITFEPSATFTGGWVYTEYRIEDSQGYSDTASVQIEYPVLIDAHYDEVTDVTAIEEVVVDVLANDEINETVTPEVWLMDGDDYRSEVTRDEGTWFVDENNSVHFVPSDTFAGGSVYISYAVSDGDGHYADSSIEIQYPIAPSLPCPGKIELNTTDDIIDVLVNMEADDHGEIEFDIDKERYTFNETAYEEIDALSETEVPNPLYWVEYNYEWENGERSPEVELGFVMLNSTSMTWHYEENETRFTTDGTESEIEDDDGNYTIEDGVYHLVLEEDGETIEVWAPKFVARVTGDELQAIMDAPAYSMLGISIDANDSAVLSIMRASEDRYDWWEDDNNDEESAEDLAQFIANHSFDDNASSYNWDSTLLHNQDTGHKAIVFATNSSTQNNGVLVEVDTENNVVINDNAGSWEIREVDGVDILVVLPTVCGYDSDRIFKVEEGVVFEGDFEERAGELSISISFNEALATKIHQSMVEIATDEAEDLATDNGDEDDNQDDGTIVASDPCPGKTELNSVDEIISLFVDMEDDAEDEIAFRLDGDRYSFNDDTYDNTAGLDDEEIFNPLYFVEYETDEDDGEKEEKVRFSEVAFDTENVTWHYEGNESIFAEDGTQTFEHEEDEGNYSVDVNNRFTLTTSENTVVWAPKFMDFVSADDLAEIMQSPQYAVLGIELDTNDSAMVVVSRMSEDRYEWWDNDNSDESAESLSQFIENHTYDANASYYDGDLTLLHNYEGENKALLFATGSSSQSSGVLVEVNEENNEILNDNAGSWEIRTVDGEDILVVIAEVCGYDQTRIYRIDGDSVERGEVELAGSYDIEIAFNKALADKIYDAMVANITEE